VHDKIKILPSDINHSEYLQDVLTIFPFLKENGFRDNNYEITSICKGEYGFSLTGVLHPKGCIVQKSQQPKRYKISALPKAMSGDEARPDILTVKKGSKKKLTN
jgi:hypothetical protein